MGAVLLQADDLAEARAAEAQEAKGGKCEFDRKPGGIRLRPIAFISRRTQTALENSSHSYVGEAATIRWAVGRFRHYLFGATFTSLTDCSGLKCFFRKYRARVTRHPEMEGRAPPIQDGNRAQVCENDA